MGTQTTDIIEPVWTDDGWMFPRNWDTAAQQEWLASQAPPATDSDSLPPVVFSLPDPNLGGIEYEHGEECDDKCGGDPNQVDGGETGTAGDPRAEDENIPSELKSSGRYAFGIVAPQDRDDIKYDNYDPREFLLVHASVWQDVTQVADEAEGLAADAIRLVKELRAQKRGMHKVNKHWSATKRELKLLDRFHQKVVESHEAELADLEQLALADRKRADIFATRLARRLRKARAGRDKRERQLQQANAVIAQANHQISNMELYISHLEKLAYGPR